MRMAMTKVAFGTMMAVAFAIGCDGSAGPSGGTPEVAPPGAADETVASSSTGVDETGKAITICVNRADWRATVTPTGGNWGTWATCSSFCPEGSFAYGFSHKSEPNQGVAGDDTALNGIRLNCNDRNTGAWTANVTSSTAAWGSWLGVAMCPQNSIESPLTQGNVQLESSQGVLDDTAANRMAGSCRLGGANVQPASNTTWGTWRGWAACPAGTAVCGIRTRVEASQGIDDDTALNGVKLECCAFCPVGQVACGLNGECLAPSACPPPPVVK